MKLFQCFKRKKIEWIKPVPLIIPFEVTEDTLYLIDLINEYRNENNLNVLPLNNYLMSLSKHRTNYYLEKNIKYGNLHAGLLAHTEKYLESQFSKIGEITMYKYSDAFNKFMQSKPHNKSILGNWDEIGGSIQFNKYNHPYYNITFGKI